MNKDKCFVCKATNNLYLRGKQYVCSNCKDTIQQIIREFIEIEDVKEAEF